MMTSLLNLSYRQAVAAMCAYLRALVLLKRVNVRHGKRPRIYGPQLRLDARGEIAIGSDFVARGRQFHSQLGCSPGGRVTLGNRVFLNQGTFIFAAKSVAIGDCTRIADLCNIFDTDFHQVTPNSPTRVSPIIIGRNVWIGSKVTVLPGSSIGDHSVIGAGSVVAGDIPDRCVAVGNPARVVSRFECADDWVRR